MPEGHWARLWDNHVRNGMMTMPCYHPAVGQCGRVDPEITGNEFVDPMRCVKNPYNVDASVAFLRDPLWFVQTNERLLHDYANGDCPVCLESFAETRAPLCTNATLRTPNVSRISLMSCVLVVFVFN